MRIVRIGLLTAAVVVATAAPASPLTIAAGVQFTRTPAVGPNQSTILVEGTCSAAATVTVALQFPVRSDALRPGLDSRTVNVNDGMFSTPLSVNFAASFPDGNKPADPVDLEVRVTCGGFTKRQPFTMSERATSSATIYTTLADGACGFGLAPTEEEAKIPCPRHVKGLTATGGFAQHNFYVRDSRSATDPFLNGGTIAAGDFDGNQTVDVVTGALPGDESFVPITDTGNDQVNSGPPDVPYPGFRGGVNVAVGDLNGDGVDDLITAAGPGGGPHVRTYLQSADRVLQPGPGFYAYGTNFAGGVTVAAADLDGDGKAEIITGAGPGGGPHVRVFKADGTPLGGGFMAYDPNFHGGVFVAAGRLANAATIVTGPGPGGGPHVRAFNGSGAPFGGGFMAYNSAFGGGVAVALGQAGIVTVPARGGGPHVRTFTDANGTAPNAGFMAYDVGNTGLRVAAL